ARRRRHGAGAHGAPDRPEHPPHLRRAGHRDRRPGRDDRTDRHRHRRRDPHGRHPREGPLMVTVVRTVAELRSASAGGTVALVPTMGALHDGHVSLMRHARPLADTLVVSIFVNPTQFAPGEDLDAYPRTFDEDLRRCEEARVDVVFAPTVETMYPAGLTDTVTVDPGPLGSVLEGEQRPTHFRGVLTVVSKLFGLVR